MHALPVQVFLLNFGKFAPTGMTIVTGMPSGAKIEFFIFIVFKQELQPLMTSLEKSAKDQIRAAKLVKKLRRLVLTDASWSITIT